MTIQDIMFVASAIIVLLATMFLYFVEDQWKLYFNKMDKVLCGGTIALMYMGAFAITALAMLVPIP